MTSFVAVAISAPNISRAKPICETADPVSLHFPLIASSNRRTLTQSQYTAVKVIRINIKLLYRFVKYTTRGEIMIEEPNIIRVGVQNFFGSVLLYFKNCVKPVTK